MGVLSFFLGALALICLLIFAFNWDDKCFNYKKHMLISGIIFILALGGCIPIGILAKHNSNIETAKLDAKHEIENCIKDPKCQIRTIKQTCLIKI